MKQGTTSRIVLRQPGGRWTQFRHDNSLTSSDSRDTQDKRPEPELVAQKGRRRRSNDAS